MSDLLLLYAIEELVRRVHGGMAVWGMAIKDVWCNLYDSSTDRRIMRQRGHKR